MITVYCQQQNKADLHNNKAWLQSVSELIELYTRHYTHLFQLVIVIPVSVNSNFTSLRKSNKTAYATGTSRLFATSSFFMTLQDYEMVTKLGPVYYRISCKTWTLVFVAAVINNLCYWSCDWQLIGYLSSLLSDGIYCKLS